MRATNVAGRDKSGEKKKSIKETHLAQVTKNEKI
jgi:hypothetical protein